MFECFSKRTPEAFLGPPLPPLWPWDLSGYTDVAFCHQLLFQHWCEGATLSYVWLSRPFGSTCIAPKVVQLQWKDQKSNATWLVGKRSALATVTEGR